VTLRGAGLTAPKPATFTLDQRGCRFVPHVLVAPVGSTLEVVNGDPVLHGVRGRTGRVTRFDLPLAGAGDRARARLDRPGPVAVGCDVHAWMTAWVVVVDAPAALAADGTFTLRDVPAGRYTLAAWHERLGERSADVVVPAEGAARVELAYGEGRGPR
jgi:plastocyanin